MRSSRGRGERPRGLESTVHSCLLSALTPDWYASVSVSVKRGQPLTCVGFENLIPNTACLAPNGPLINAHLSRMSKAHHKNGSKSGGLTFKCLMTSAPWLGGGCVTSEHVSQVGICVTGLWSWVPQRRRVFTSLRAPSPGRAV